MSNGQLVSIIDRIIRLHEEEEALKQDRREVYAEAKSSGFDKTALGAAVTRIRKNGKLSDVERVEEERDLMVAAYDGAASHTHAREEGK
jgi:uncharacterized protein (UPF0335 family)